MAGLLGKAVLILYCLHLNLRSSNNPELLPYSNTYDMFFLSRFESKYFLSEYNIKLTGECACLGDTLTYNCAVLGRFEGATVWSGTVFDCASNDVTLLHSAYRSDVGAFGMCNNGAIAAWSLGVENSYYTSQLYVRLTSDVVGKTIACINVLNLTTQVIQFSTTIENITGKYFMFIS